MSPFKVAIIIWVAFFIGVIILAVKGQQTEYIEVPSEPEIIYVEKEVEKEVEVGELPYYKTIAENITQEEIDLVAKLAYEEAGNQSLVGQRAVVEVVFNRKLSNLFPNTIYEVIYQENPTQFTPAYKLVNTVPTEEQYAAVQAVLSESVPILNADVLYFSTGTNGHDVYEKIGAHYFCY